MRAHKLIKKNGKSGEVSNPIRKNIAAFLENERKALDLNAFQMWQRIRGDDEDFARGTYLDTIRAQNNITLRTLESLADKMNTSIAELFGVTDPTPQMKSYKADDLHKRLAKFVEQERLTRKMLHREMAAKLEVSYVTYLRIRNETGNTNMAVDTLAGIALALRVDPITYLFVDNPQ